MGQTKNRIKKDQQDKINLRAIKSLMKKDKILESVQNTKILWTTIFIRKKYAQSN